MWKKRIQQIRRQRDCENINAGADHHVFGAQTDLEHSHQQTHQRTCGYAGQHTQHHTVRVVVHRDGKKGAKEHLAFQRNVEHTGAGAQKAGQCRQQNRGCVADL